MSVAQSPMAQPPIVRLRPSFDAERLAADFHRVRELVAGTAAGYPGEGHVGWTSICVQSASASSGDSPSLARAPYLRSVLADLNLRLRLARLLSLEPGGVIREHSDSFLSRRIVRLHVPIITAPEVELYVGGARCHWKAGELWYGDFSLPHRGVNRSNLTRVHLVLDVTADDNLLALFQPEEIPLALAALGPMESEGEVDPRLLERFAVDFTLPPGFSLPGAGHQNLDAAIDGCIRLVDSELCVFVNQQPMLKASPVSEDTLDLPGLGADARLEYAFQNDAVHSVTLTMGGAPIFSFEVRSPA